MDVAQRTTIIEGKLTPLGMTVKEWAKMNDLDHRLVANLIQGNLRGTHGVSLTARKKMEEYFGPIFES